MYAEDVLVGFFKSLALHVFLIVIALTMGIVFKLFPDSLPKSEKVTIITSSVKVDLVGMPKMSLLELKKMDLPQIGQTREAPAKSDTAIAPNVDASKIEFEQVDKKKSVSDLLKSFSQKKIAQNPTENKKSGSKSGIDQGALNKLILEGNKLSQGSSLTGDINNNQIDGEFQKYALSLPNRIRPFWKLPSFLLEQNLNCRVRIFIGSSGEILKAEIYTKSGDVEYDTKAVEAVRKAAPFPKPNSEIQTRLAMGEIILGFPL
jgi:TonB family protein